MQPSMSGKGNGDNKAAMESFLGRYKTPAVRDNDWLSYAQLVCCINEEVDREAPAGTLREYAVNFARDFHARGLWVPGELNSGGFHPRTTPPEASAKAMRIGLADIDRCIYPGDICWFELTAAGHALLKAGATAARPPFGTRNLGAQ
jgi:hypothetical protein